MADSSPKAVKLSQIKDKIGITNEIKKDFVIHALTPLEFGGQGDISYIDQPKYLPSLATSKVSAVLLREEFASQVPSHIEPLIVPNPHLAFALLSHFFTQSEFCEDSLKSSQEPHLRETNKIHSSVKIMQGAYIGQNVEIGQGSIIMSGAVLSDNVCIGQNCKIYPNVVIYRQSKIADNVNIHANAVIGSDGFGYAHTAQGEHIKIEHNGIVEIESNVEIGAGSTIDRAVFGKTLIKKGTKIDNLVQIGHNCVIGEHSLLVSQVGLAGSTTTGRNVVMGGQAGTGGHIHIGDFVQIAGRGAVGKNLPPNTKWGGHPLMELDAWMKFFVTLRKMVKKSEKA